MKIKHNILEKVNQTWNLKENEHAKQKMKMK